MSAISSTELRRTRFLTLFACLLAFALVSAACGDDADDEAAEAPAAAGDNETDDATARDDSDEAAVDDAESTADAVTLTANLTDSCAESVAEGVDLFPDKVEPAYAENFSVSYHGTYKVLTINEPFPGGAAESYVLVQCGAEAPAAAEAPAPVAATIEVPIDALLSSSTTHLPLIEQLGRIDDLVGVSNLGLVSSEAVLAEAERLIEYAPDFTLDTEVALTAGADVLMTGGTEDEGHQVLRDAGLAVVANAEWLEPTPLGRAEWIKYAAVLFNEEAAATERFAEIEAAYDEIAARAAEVADDVRPTVMTGADFGGTFYAAGGNSYVATLIDDAGGAYVWSDNADTGSVELDLEAQLERAGEADIWINGSTSWTSLDAMLEEEPRYGEFASHTKGQVWVYSKIQNENGGIEYFERGVTRPDLVLADLLKVFHPELAEDHTFEWYEQVGP